MSTQTLTSVTQATIENYRHAANQTTRATVEGSRRLIGAFNQAVETRIEPPALRYAPQIAAPMRDLRGRMTEAMVAGIERLAEGTDKAVGLGTDGALRGVDRLAAMASAVQQPVVANGLKAVARFSLPGAKAALAMSGRLADSADALSAAAGRKPRKPVAARKPQAAAAPKAAARRAPKARVAAKAPRARRAAV